MNRANLPTFGDVSGAVRLMTTLPRVLRDPITPTEARAHLHHQLTHREDQFLDLARNVIYGNTESPYRRLLLRAGCEYGDLEQLVRSEGLENALRRLFRLGVYLTVDEFKRRRSVVRNGDEVKFSANHLWNPLNRPDIAGSTGGSRGSATLVPIEFSSLRAHAMDVMLDLEMRRGLDWVHALWSVPGSGAFNHLIYYNWCRQPISHWFALVDPNSRSLHARYRWSGRLLRLAGRMAGVRMPPPTVVQFRDAVRIARWMSDTLRSGKTGGWCCRRSR